MAQLAQSLRLNLADALACDVKFFPDFLQRMHAAVRQAVAQAQHALLPRRERLQHARQLLAQHGIGRGVRRLLGLVVLNEVAEVAVILLADRRLE